jgi:hypothetical protein
VFDTSPLAVRPRLPYCLYMTLNPFDFDAQVSGSELSSLDYASMIGGEVDALFRVLVFA